MLLKENSATLKTSTFKRKREQTQKLTEKKRDAVLRFPPGLDPAAVSVGTITLQVATIFQGVLASRLALIIAINSLLFVCVCATESWACHDCLL